MQPYILPAFNGPLDLLVLLVQREEINIFDFPIRELIRQYKGREDQDELDNEIAHIRDLSSLVQLKTEKLLPIEAHEAAEPEEPPSDFLNHLMQYSAFKTIASELSKKEDVETSFYLRGSKEEIPPAVQTTTTSLQDFAKAFERILQEASLRKLRIPQETWTVEGKIASIRQSVQQGTLEFTSLFSLEKPKEELIVTFLAVLELLKQEKIKLTPNAQYTFVISKNML